MASKTWTTTPQFNGGEYLNTDASTVAGQVQLTPSVGGAYVVVAFANYDQHEVVLIAHNGVTAPTIVGRVLVSSAGFPSRIAWRSDGTAWVLVWDSSLTTVRVVRLGVVIGGARCNSDGTLNAAGLYRTNPFTVNTTGQSIVLSWMPEVGGAALTYGTDQALIETSAVLTITSPASGGVALDVDSSDNAWISSAASASNVLSDWHKVTAGVVVTTQAGQLASGNLWHHGGHLFGCPRTTTSAATSRIVDAVVSPFSVTGTTLSGFDSINALVASTDGSVLWVSASPTNSAFGRIDLYNATTKALLASTTNIAAYQDIDTMWPDTDLTRVWAASATSAVLYRFRYDGSAVLIVESWNIFGASWGASTTNNADARVDGLAMDSNGMLWMHRRGGYAHEVDVTFAPTLVSQTTLSAQVTFSNQRNGGRPATEIEGSTNSTLGTWEDVYDAGQSNTWQTISWNDTIPANQTLTVQYRVSQTLDGLNTATYTTVLVGTTGGAHSFAMSGSGRFVGVLVTWARLATDSNTAALLDLTIAGVVDQTQHHPAGHFASADPIPLDPIYGGWDGMANVSGARVAVGATAGATDGV